MLREFIRKRSAKVFIVGILFEFVLAGYLFAQEELKGCPDSPKQLSTTPGDVNCNPEWVPEKEGGDTYIEPSGSVTIRFQGGTLPFTYEISGNDFWLNNDKSETVISNSPQRSIQIFTGSQSCNAAQLTVTDDCENAVTETIFAAPITFNYGSMEDVVVDRNNHITLTVNGGVSPFLWTVSGQGFYLDSEHTLTQKMTSFGSITVYADETACGSGKITVTDNCNATFNGYLRSSEGRWTHCYGSGVIRGGYYCDCTSVYETGPHEMLPITYMTPTVRLYHYVQTTGCSSYCCRSDLGNSCLFGNTISCSGVNSGVNACYNPCLDEPHTNILPSNGGGGEVQQWVCN